jgi:hypothetical protein
MPNPARLDWILGSFGMVMLACAGCAGNPGYDARLDRAAIETAHAERLTAEASDGRRLEIERQVDGVWIGTLTAGGRRHRATSSTCPEFARAIDEFRRLPPLKPGPYSLQSHPEVRPIPPTTMDGAAWTITTPAFDPEWADVLVTIRGDQGRYAGWANRTSRLIPACA